MKKKTLIPIIVNQLIVNIFLLKKILIKKNGKTFQYFSKFQFTLETKRTNPNFFSNSLIKK